MEFQVFCPHCNKVIKASDFDKSENSLSALKDYFDSHKQLYIKQLQVEIEKKINEDNKVKNDLQIQAATSKLLSEIESIKKEKLISEEKCILTAEKNFLIAKQEIINENNSLRTEIEKLKSEIEKNKININNERENQKNIIELEVKKNEINLKSIFQNQIDSYKEKINQYEINSLKGRTVNIGIKGSNLENEFETNMLQIYNDGSFEKTTKAINGRKPDFKLSIKRDDQTLGSILFEIKNTEKMDSDFEDKLSKEIIEWNSNYGVIVWSNFKGTIKSSDTHTNIFIVNTELSNITTLIGLLKIIILKEYNIIKNGNKNAQEVEDFRTWINQKLSKTISNLVSEVDKLHDQIEVVNRVSENLLKIEEKMRSAIIKDIEQELKNRGFK